MDHILDQMDLKHIYGTLHSSVAEHTFFSSAHRILSRIDHRLGHKTSLSKCKEIKTIPFPITGVLNKKSIIGGKQENSQICGN